MRFDFTFNLGHLMTVATAIVAVGLAWSNATAQIGALEARTASYPVVRDTVLTDNVRLDALTSAIAAQTASNDAVMRSLNALREDVSAIRATLAARSGP